MGRMARQHIEFPPYLVKAPSLRQLSFAHRVSILLLGQAPPEWREKIPALWSRVKESFGVRDCSEAGRVFIQVSQKGSATKGASRKKA